MEPRATPTRRAAGPAPLRWRRTGWRRRPRCCPPCWDGKGPLARSTISLPPSRCMGGPRRLRQGGRRATDARFLIRPARLADVAPVAAIERASFSDPWSERDFRDCVASGVPFLIAVEDASVAGDVIARHAVDEGGGKKLRVDPARRRRGAGGG